VSDIEKELKEIIQQRDMQSENLRHINQQREGIAKHLTELNDRRTELEEEIARQRANSETSAWPKRFTKTVHGSDEDEVLSYFATRVCGFKDGTDPMWQVLNCAYEVTLSFEVDQNGAVKLIGAQSGSDTVGVNYHMPAGMILQLD
jgi:hypothetical protein